MSLPATGNEHTLGNPRAGLQITVRRLDTTFRWFSEHRPEGLEWPRDIPRPQREVTA